MKTLHNIMAAAAVIVAAGLFAPAAHAADTPAMPAATRGVTIGILDMDRVMRESTAAKGIVSEVEAKRKVFEDQINKEEKSLLDTEKSIMAEKSKLSDAEFAKKRDDFEKKVADGKKMLQDRRQTLDKAFGASMGKLRTEVLKISADIAKERSYDMILSDEAVVMAEPAYDITTDVVARLNKSVTKVPVEWAK
jgi:Skp family chaperone for outer membrane proteins